MSKTGYVYLMKNNRNGYIKVGFTTKKPEFREATLASEDPDITLIHSQYGLTMQEEKELHKIYANKRLRGEWFDLSGDEIDIAIVALQRMFVIRNKNRVCNKNMARCQIGGIYEGMVVNEVLYSLYKECSDLTTIGDKTVIMFSNELMACVGRLPCVIRGKLRKALAMRLQKVSPPEILSNVLTLLLTSTNASIPLPMLLLLTRLSFQISMRRLRVASSTF